MKKIVIPICIATFLSIGACNNNKGSDNDSDSTTTGSSTTNASGTTAATVDTNRNNNASNDTSATSTNTNNNPDGDFIKDAANGGLMEVELGKYASTNAMSPKVKEFGRMMVTDHTKANAALKTVTDKKNITLPTAPEEKQQSHINDLTAKKGADFDKDYVDMMVDDHKEDISKIEDEAKNGKDPDVKAFAAKTLPVLYKHLNSIKAIKDGMKK
jgi:putative membrane protein